MIPNRSLTVNFSASLLGLVVVVGLTALVVINAGGHGLAAGSTAGQPVLSAPASQRSIEAYSARWAGLAHTFAPVQAYSARWAGLAELFAPSAAELAYAARAAGQAQMPTREIVAYSARWNGLAQLFSPTPAELAYAARAAGQAEMPTREEAAYSARWTGLAEYYLQTR